MNQECEYTKKLDIPQLPEEIKNRLEMDITEQEISQALLELNNQKSPGTDGIPPEFLKVFWARLKPLFAGMFEEIVQGESLHLTARYGILSLLEKTNRNMLDLTSWRPLTLLNSDNKSYGKVLANRLQIAIKHLVHYSQNGFIKGRVMSENIIRIMEAINYCEKEGVNALLICFDYLKAFDTLEWKAIYHALTSFGFGPKYIQMVKILFAKPITYASNNGFWSESFTPTRGCRQGCTYSPGIFALTVELLGLALRQNKQIKGVEISPNNEVKAGQFADDLWTFTPAEAGQVNAVLAELESFRKFSGLTINPDKCAELKIGPHRDTDAVLHYEKSILVSEAH